MAAFTDRFCSFYFYNSSMPAAESHRASELVGSILTGMGKWFGIDVPQQNLDYNIRKLAHFWSLLSWA